MGTHSDVVGYNFHSMANGCFDLETVVSILQSHALNILFSTASHGLMPA